MRLKPERIEHLANIIYESLEANAEVALGAERDKIVLLIRQIVTDDLTAEDEIEAEARKVLDAHRDEIQRKGMSFDKLLQKAKQRIAQERKMVL